MVCRPLARLLIRIVTLFLDSLLVLFLDIHPPDMILCRCCQITGTDFVNVLEHPGLIDTAVGFLAFFTFLHRLLVKRQFRLTGFSFTRNRCSLCRLPGRGCLTRTCNLLLIIGLFKSWAGIELLSLFLLSNHSVDRWQGGYTSRSISGLLLNSLALKII